MKQEEMRDIIARNSFAAFIGMELLDAADDCVYGRIHFEPRHENIYGGMHGGCAFSLADTLAGAAAALSGDMVTTLNASMNYMLPVINTEYLYCRAKVVRRGGKICVVRTELSDDDGRLLVDGSFTYYCLGKRLHERTNI